MVLQKIQGDSPRPQKQNPFVTQHVLPTVFSADVTGIPAEEGPGVCSSWDSDKFISVIELTSAWPPESEVYHPLPRRDTLPFLLLSRQMGPPTRRWDVPTADIAVDFINETICILYGDDYPYADGYDRTGKWGLFTVIYIKASSPTLLEEFRRHISRHTSKGFDFDTFPKDVITAKPDISILLRNNMKSFAIEMIPKVLFMRNKNILAGALRVLSTTRFKEGETSQKGEAKDEWRQIQLKGNEQLLRCLRFLPESTPFLLGVEPVQIKGGLRPQEAEHSSLLGKRTWGSNNPQTVPPVILNPNNGAPRGRSNSSGRGYTPKRGRSPKRGFFSRDT